MDRVVARCRAAAGDSLLFGHGHGLRVLAARWLGLPVEDGRLLVLQTGTVSVLGHERRVRPCCGGTLDRSPPVLDG